MNDDVLFDLKQSSGSDSEDSALPKYVKTIQDQEEKKQVIEEE